MPEKEIALLKQQIERLSEKKFDLEAWKQHTLIFLERIFGKDSSKIKMIRDLNYDYSSWSLRDTAAAGKTKDKDPIRMQAEEILQATVLELETLGLPHSKNEKAKVWELLQDELTGRQMKEIESILKSDVSDKTEKIGNILENLETESLAMLIAKIINS